MDKSLEDISPKVISNAASSPHAIRFAMQRSKDREKYKIAAQMYSIIWRMYYGDEITNNCDVIEDLKYLDSLREKITEWLIEQRYKK